MLLGISCILGVTLNKINVLQPPQAPEIERKLEFHRVQLIGMPLLAIIPILSAGPYAGGRREDWPKGR